MTNETARERSSVEITVSREEKRSIEQEGRFGVTMQTRLLICRPRSADVYGFDGLLGLSLTEARLLHERLGQVLSEFGS